MKTRKPLAAMVLLVTMALEFGTLPPAGAGILGGAAGSTLRREPQLTPEALGDNALPGLQYADPTEGIDLVDSPKPNNQGTAALSLPLGIPQGRGGVQPDLTLRYDSSGESSWLGLGWDLNLGEISVDTEFGVPRYDSNLETETYALDGATLSPTAVTSDPVPRNRTVRDDFTRRVDDDQALIIRHGDNPRNYWWEVRTKMGGIKWYGGFPDDGGPTGGIPVPDLSTPDPDDEILISGEGTRDPSAILTDDGTPNGNAYRWALSAERDVGVNMMRYYYKKVENQPVGAEGAGIGRQLYLDRIEYTSTSDVGGRPDDPREDPAYQVKFLRDGDVGATRKRQDVVVSGRGGFLEVTTDLLRRVEINYGQPVTCASPHCDKRRTYNILAKRFNLNYDLDGPYGKTLLKSVDQIGADGNVYATNAFDYFDDVRSGGGYNGFSGAGWESPSDGLAATIVGETMGGSALGSSQTIGVDGHVYLGFAPFDPQKEGSIGGSITIKGGVTEATAELFDINGDQLPDKVFRDGTNIRFRLNMGGPGGEPKFGDSHSASGISTLSSEWNIGVGGAVEAYAGVAVQFSIAGEVEVGEDYFTDVNFDGLPDLVSGGKVQFNHLGADGVPSFSGSSEGTAVPIDSRQLQLPPIQKLQDLETQQRAQSPLQDTVRRWIAPFAGSVSVTGPVTFEPPPDTRNPAAPYNSDGVRVAIERNGVPLWATRLLTPGQVATPTGVGSIDVAAGDPIYFRLQSIDDGRRDQVKWDPIIQYVGKPEALDVNGLDTWKYTASKEFTLGGRSGVSTQMPLDGHVRIAGKVHKARATTDDVTVLAVLRRHDGTLVPRTAPTIPAAFVGDVPVDIQLDVLGPDGDEYDAIFLKLAVDTPIDVAGVSWTSDDGKDGPPMYYTSATTPEGVAVRTLIDGKYVIQLHPLYDIDLYSASNRAGPQPAPVLFPTNTNPNLHETLPVSGVDARFSVPGDVDRSLLPARMVFSVKSRAGYACKGVLTIPFSPAPTPGLPTPQQLVSNQLDCPTFNAQEGEPYWFDFTTADARLARLGGLHLTAHGVDDNDLGVHWPRVPINENEVDVFPEAWRGWAFAGYNGDGQLATQPIDPSAFHIDRDDYPEDKPTGLDDADPTKHTGFKNPTQGRSFPYIPFFLQQLDTNTHAVVAMTPVWRGLKDNTVGAAGYAVSSRTAADDPSITRLTGVGAGGESVSAVRKVGVTGPTLSLFGGFSVFGGSFTIAPSFGLLDYVDMNGDSFPDVVAPGYVKYTGPRGAYNDGGSGVEPARDFTIAISGGFDGSAGDVNGNAEGDVNTAQNTKKKSGTSTTKTSSSTADSGDDGTDKEYGYSIGATLGVSTSFTNPAGPDSDSFSDFASAVEEMGGLPTDLERELADVNGDGLPDEVMVRPSGVYVRLNLGYKFGPEIRWASGGFETGQSVGASAGLGLGFEIFHKGLSGGVGYNEDVNFPIYSWVDVNGDGILDRLHRDGLEIRVAFGTGSGIGADVDYGNFQQGAIDLVAGISIPTGEQVAMNHTRGLGAGFDITIPIGPLCPIFVGCWIIINPGVHVDTSWSATRVQVADINGDGYADSLASDDDNGVDVQLNNHGRTNLLKAVHNPLGGTIRMDYARAGNTVAQPSSLWDLSTVLVDDGRPGDGVDTQLTTFEYSGNRYNPLERAVLGYGTVTERQRADRGDSNPGDDPLLRSIVRHYRNQTVFDTGLLTSELLEAADGKPLKETRTDWKLVELARLATGEPADLGHRDDDPAGVRFLGMAVARERTKVENRWYDAAGNLGENTWTTYAYDDLANVSRQVDVGEPEIPGDDVTAITTYSTCQDAASAELHVPFPCPAPRPVGRVSPLWNEFRCPTWTSIPATFQVLDAQGKVMRERNGAPALCDNSSVTHIEESIGGGQSALTQLDYDEWGSYNHIVYPANADGERVRIDYVYDDEAGHANIARTTRSICMLAPAEPAEADPCNSDNDPTGELTVATATFESTSGRIASRTDANGQTTTYTYDRFARIQDIRAPFERATAKPTVHFDYAPTNPAYAWAAARHYDAFNPGNTIDTVTFVDGIGRQTQTKQDATLFRGADAAPADVRIVSGAVEFDELGRVVNEWYPTEEPLGTVGAEGVRNPATSPRPPTTTAWNLLDAKTKITYPDSSFESVAYGFGGQADFGANVFKTTFTDRQGKPQVTYTDARENAVAVDDAAIGAPSIRTRYAYDGLGQLTEVVDNGGNKTNHTYDVLGRLTSTRTPDGGLVEQRWDAASNLIGLVDPNMRAAGVQTTYHYDGERLTSIDYPPGTPDVAYTWGGAAARGDDHGNGTGRIIAVKDGARDQTLAYDKMGNVAADVSTMLVHNLNDSTGQRLTYTTTFDYDTYGRMKGLVYPDGEVLSNTYDSGGLLKGVSGQKAGRPYGYVDRLEYDEFLSRRFERTGNGVRTEYGYNPLTRRLERQVTNTPAREVQDLNYTYDKVGNVLKMDNQLPAAVPSLKGAPSVQTYTYDPYYRLKSAAGTHSGAPDKIQTYTFSNTYDTNGNITAKAQTDQIGKISQKPTTYDLTLSYRADKPHELAKIGSQTYKYDANGNFTGWTDDKSGASRTVTWDATNRVRSMADQGSTTTYAYDDTGRLAIERGPGGETAFVNNWYTVKNGSVAWKNIWAGDDRVALQRVFTDGTYEQFRYFMHKDLQGSTNIVTDDTGLVFQHLEYFPSGEQWVVEQGTDNRTPYLFGGAYVDEVRQMVNVGARWYQPREQFAYSPEPVLQEDPRQVIDDPGLLPAYSYAESNPLRLVDPDGRRSRDAQAALLQFGKELRQPETQARLQASITQLANVLATADPVPSAAETKKAATKARWESRKKTFKKFTDPLGAKPLVEVNFQRTKDGFKFQNVKVAPSPIGKQFTVPGKKKKP